MCTGAEKKAESKEAPKEEPKKPEPKKEEAKKPEPKQEAKPATPPPKSQGKPQPQPGQVSQLGNRLYSGVVRACVHACLRGWHTACLFCSWHWLGKCLHGLGRMPGPATLQPVQAAQAAGQAAATAWVGATAAAAGELLNSSLCAQCMLSRPCAGQVRTAVALCWHLYLLCTQHAQTAVVSLCAVACLQSGMQSEAEAPLSLHTCMVAEGWPHICMCCRRLLGLHRRQEDLQGALQSGLRGAARAVLCVRRQLAAHS